MQIDLPVARVVDGGVVETHDALPDTWQSTIHYRNAGPERWAADGWRQLQIAVVPDGQQVVSRYYEIADELVIEHVTTEAIPPPDVTTPDIYQRPIEVPTLVLQSKDAGLGVALECEDDGSLYTYQYHASPVDPAEVAANRAAARKALSDKAAAEAAAAVAAKQAAAAAAAAASGAGAANSVAALRGEVARLASEVERLAMIIEGMAGR